MKKILILVLLFVWVTILFAQQSQYLTYTSVMKIAGVKNGERFEWENKNINVRLDYKSGEFITYLENDDFVNTDMDLEDRDDTTTNKRKFTLQGTFPISDIINQQQEKQNFMVELQLKNDDLYLSEPVMFDMLISRPEAGNAKGYRIFSLNGVLYNDELNLPAFEGFENEIELWLMFSGFMNIQ